jgi:hypothetical protein
LGSVLPGLVNAFLTFPELFEMQFVVVVVEIGTPESGKGIRRLLLVALIESLLRFLAWPRPDSTPRAT